LFDVVEKRRLKVAAGDKLLLQANAARKQFINGELVEVQAIQGDSVVLTDGRVIPHNYRTFTHGYAVTSHAAQGKTVDEVRQRIAQSHSLRKGIGQIHESSYEYHRQPRRGISV
jgi:ATP-dependent exoDNAse (exonuclease V) alpha subunit